MPVRNNLMGNKSGARAGQGMGQVSFWNINFLLTSKSPLSSNAESKLLIISKYEFIFLSENYSHVFRNALNGIEYFSKANLLPRLASPFQSSRRRNNCRNTGVISQTLFTGHRELYHVVFLELIEKQTDLSYST